MSEKTLIVHLTVSNRAHEQLLELIEFLEEQLVFAVANTLDVPADFTTMNAAVQLDDVPASAQPGGFEFETGE